MMHKCIGGCVQIHAHCLMADTRIEKRLEKGAVLRRMWRRCASILMTATRAHRPLQHSSNDKCERATPQSFFSDLAVCCLFALGGGKMCSCGYTWRSWLWLCTEDILPLHSSLTTHREKNSPALAKPCMWAYTANTSCVLPPAHFSNIHT